MAKKSKQTYQHKENAVSVTLYDTTGENLDPRAKEEIESYALLVAEKYPNTLISIATT